MSFYNGFLFHGKRKAIQCWDQIIIKLYIFVIFIGQEEMEAFEKTYNQVVMDVNRSSSRFPPGKLYFIHISMRVLTPFDFEKNMH